jgi:hypothetical protein
VTAREWHSARWQRLHSVRSVPDLAAVFGRALADDLAADIRHVGEPVGGDVCQQGPAGQTIAAETAPLVGGLPFGLNR